MLIKKKKELEDSKRALEKERSETASLGDHNKSALSDDDHS